MAEVSQVEFQILIHLPEHDMTNIVTVGSLSMTPAEDGIVIDKTELAAHLRQVADTLENGEE